MQKSKRLSSVNIAPLNVTINITDVNERPVFHRTGLDLVGDDVVYPEKLITGKEYQIDLSAYFSDPDGDQLYFSYYDGVLASYPGVESLSTAGILTIMPG